MNRLPAFVLRCLLWACLFVGSRSAEGSFPKSSPPCPVTVTLPDPVAFTHDARGNLLNDGQPLLAYDAEDQLTSIRVPPTATAAGWETQFVYDGLGRLRIRREITVPATGSTTARTTNQVRYLYDGFTAVQERDGNNAVLATYTRGNDLSGSPQGAGGIGGLLARTEAGGSVFYHADAGGNVTTLFNAAQAVVGRYAYDPFGNLLGMSGAGAAGNRYRFSSKEVHPQTGMYYYGFRFYEPNLQRWTSRDPIEEMGGLNLYGFVGNSPVNYVDPLGLESFMFPPQYAQSREFRDGFNQGMASSALGFGSLFVPHPVRNAEALAGYSEMAGNPTLPWVERGLGGLAALGTTATMILEWFPAYALVENGAQRVLAASAARKLPCPAAKSLPQFTQSTIDDVIASAAQARSAQITEGARAIAKKLGHAESGGYNSAFQGIAPTQANAESLIRNIMSNPSRTFYGDKVIDIYNAAGQGVRIEVGSGRFKGFLEGTLATQ